MNPVSLQTTEEKYIISIDRTSIDVSIVLQIVQRIRIEHLSREMNLDENVELLGDEIKANWWQQNKSRFIIDEAVNNNLSL